MGIWKSTNCSRPAASAAEDGALVARERDGILPEPTQKLADYLAGNTRQARNA